MSTQELGSLAAAPWAVLQIVALAFAVLMSRKMPAASQQLDEKAPPSRGSTTNEPPRPAATIPAGFPAANQIVDVSALSAGVCRLYWLAASAKFGAVTLALGILSRNNDPQSGSFQFTWGMGIVAGAGVLLALSIAFTLQEDWIRPGAALALGLGLISAICFVPVSFTMDPRVHRNAQRDPPGTHEPCQQTHPLPDRPGLDSGWAGQAVCTCPGPSPCPVRGPGVR
jgi:hypothetical protein